MRLYLSIGRRTAGSSLLADLQSTQDMKLYLADIVIQNHSFAQAGVLDKGQALMTDNKLHLRILISYFYYKDTDLDKLFARYFKPPYPEVFADSGAFSAWSLGQPIDVAAYADWLHKWKKYFTVYANLDVKGDVEAGLRNQAYLESRDLAPLPVFHGGEPWSVLQDLIAQYPYIALGGIAGEAFSSGSQEIMAWLVRCFKLAKDKSVYHGFGMTRWTTLKSFPWYSADSSSWGQGFRFGNVPVFDYAKGEFVKLNLGNKKHFAEQSRLVESYGFDWRDFADRVRNDRSKICAISAMSYMKAELWLRKRWGEVHIPTRDTDSGPKLSLSVGALGGGTTGVDGLGLALGPKLHLATGEGRSGPSHDGNSTANTGIGSLANAVGPKVHLADANKSHLDSGVAAVEMNKRGLL